WVVDRREGLDDLVEGATPWDKLYVEKGDYGFLRVGPRRVPVRLEVDEPAHALRIWPVAGRDDAPIEATFVLHEHALHLEGLPGGKRFSIDLTREFPR